MEAQIAAARAATVFTLWVIAVRLAAEEDPQWWLILGVIAANPSYVTTAMVMAAVAQQTEGAS